MKNNILIGKLVLLLVCFSLINCEKEGNFDTMEGVSAKKFKTITLQELNSSLIHDAFFENLSTLFDVNRNSELTQRSEALNNAMVLTDEIVQVKTDNGSAYTFKMIAYSEENEFYNLVLLVDKQGVITDNKIIKYKPSESWVSNPTRPFSGNVSVVKSSNFLTESFTFNRVTQCIVDVTTEWDCNAGNNHPPDSCPYGGSDLIVTLVYGACPPELDDEMDDAGTPFDTSGSTGSGGSSVSSGSETNTTPLPPCGFTFDGNYSSDCLDPNEYDIALQLNTILHGGDTYTFDDTLTNEETIDVNSIEEIEVFFNNLLESNFTNASSVFEAGSVRRDIHKMEFTSFPQVDILAAIKVMVPDANNNLECLDILDANTYIDGDTSLTQWNQENSSDPTESDGVVVTINEELDAIKINILGTMTVGFEFLGVPFTVDKLLTILITYNYSSGELNTDYSYWYFTNN